MRSLTPGFHLYATPGGSWRLAEPGGRFQRIVGDDDRLTDIARALDAGIDLVSLGADAAALQQQLVDRGALPARGTTTPSVTIAPKRLAIVGSGTVADALRTILAAQPALMQIGDDGPHVDAIVSIEPWFRDRRWGALSGRGLPLHRCHDDGSALFVGPFHAEAGSASYLDYRGRRRAAAPLLTELDALWAHLDSLPDAPLSAPPGTAGIAAAIIAADLFAWASGAPTPTATAEMEIRSDGSVHRHPVLPLPRLSAR